MCEATFKFTPPPEAPIFRPTLKEFEDPLIYLEKIRPIGSKTGICKIIPPKGWNPPFAVDVNTFRFTPRIQRLYELEAHSRLKLDFIGKLYQFIRLQGMEKLKIPNIGGHYLDVYWLHKHVMNAGGYEKVNSAKLWPQIAESLCYPSNKFAMAMKTNYEKLLLRYELVVCAHLASGKNGRRSVSPDNARSTPSKRTRLHSPDDTKIDYSASKELRNLQFYGPGPKTVVPIRDVATPSNGKQDNTGEYFCRVCGLDNNEASLLICSTSTCQACYHTYCLTPPLSEVPHYQWKCPECVRLLCSRPMDSFGFPQSPRSYTLHEFGLRADAFKAKYFRREPSSVPCAEVEQEFWRILQEYTEDVVVEYGADVHASDQGSGFPTELQLLRSPHLFGPAEQRRQALVYAQSPWNLNNLPIYGNSVLRFIKGNVDGMKVPWCYVGMVFSTFCWHIEDHWSCSINFNHWGEPKTWYGVSSQDAELFERAMRKQADELFQISPDLLHHITTIMNPNLLMAEGVPIYRTDQHCGEFVVTFPRAYHAGFNQGFNFAEAVNVCPPAWLPIGRACVEHYSQMHRQCVFSNDELLFRLAEVVAGRQRMDECANYTEMASERFRSRDCASRTCFEVDDLRVIHDEFATIVGREVRARRRLVPLCARAVRFRIDRMLENDDATPITFGDDDGDENDDARICVVCQTTLFLSAIACNCKSHYLTAKDWRSAETLGQKRKSTPAAPSCADGKPKQAFMVCLEHAESVCDNCPLSECTLYYTHSLEELETIRDAVAARMTDYAAWRHTFTPFFLPDATPTTAFSAVPPSTKFSLETFEKHLKDAQLFGYHTDKLYKRTNSYLEDVKDLIRVCEKAANFVLDLKLEIEDSEAAKLLRSAQKQESQFEFQVRRRGEAPSGRGGGKTRIVRHSIDLKNPREADFLSLLEAVELEEAFVPIDLTQRSDFKDDGESENEHQVLSSVARLRRLFHLLLPEWRTGVLAALEENALCRGDSEHSLSHLQSRLAHPVRQLLDEFPGWCKNSEEVQIVVLIEEICRWNCASGKGLNSDVKTDWCSLSDLLHHLEWGKQLESRLASTSLISVDVDAGFENGNLRTSATRRQRKDGNNVSDGSSTNESSLPTVIVACRPVLEELKSLLNTTLSNVLEALTQAQSALLTLVDTTRDLHLLEPAVKSSLSAVGQSLNSLASCGFCSVGDDTKQGLASMIDNAQLTHCLTACLVENTLSDHRHHHLRASETSEVEALEMVVSRLIFEWCFQVTRFLSSSEHAECPEKSESWLSHLSDLLGLERFIFGSRSTMKAESLDIILPPVLVQCRDDLDAFCDLNLNIFRNLAGRFVDNVNFALPNDLFNLVLQATAVSSLSDDTLLQLHRTAFNRDFESFEGLLKVCSEVHSTKIRSALSDTTASGLCNECRRCLGLAIDTDSPDTCPLCVLVPPRQRAVVLTVADLTQSIETDAVNSSYYVLRSLVHAVISCTRVVELRYCDWLLEIDRFMNLYPKATGRFFVRESEAFVEGLPDPLKSTASKLRGLEVESAVITTAVHYILLPLLVEGQALSAIISSPSVCNALLRGLLLL